MMHADDTIQAFQAYCAEAIELHQGDLAEPGPNDDLQSIMADLARYKAAAAVLEEFREYVCRMSEVAA